jgi:hypothetical protein
MSRRTTLWGQNTVGTEFVVMMKHSSLKKHAIHFKSTALMVSAALQKIWQIQNWCHHPIIPQFLCRVSHKLKIPNSVSVGCCYEISPTGQVEKSPCLNGATQFLMVAYDDACSPNVSVRMAWISNDTIDSIPWHWEVGQAKDLAASLLRVSVWTVSSNNSTIIHNNLYFLW